MRRKAAELAHSVLLLGLAAGFMVPLAWVVAASLRSPGLPPPQGVEWWPQPASPANYPRLFSVLPIARFLGNSSWISAVAVAMTLVTASWAGFGMARLAPPTRRRLLMLAGALLLVPPSAMWLPRFLLFRWVGLLDTHAALLLPAAAGSSPLFVLLFYWGVRRLPKELWEAAALDGAGVLTQWRCIAMPALQPTVAAVAVLTFVQYWGDFLSPLLYLRTPELYTLPVGLQHLQQLDRTDWPILMAGCVVLTVPPALLFLATQRTLLESRYAGGGPPPVESG